MDISNITSAHNTTDFLDPAQLNRATGKQMLDVNDFLKLLTVQMTSQDPMKPIEDTQFIAQMASFTSLEQMKGLAKNFAEFSSAQRIDSAQNYLGKLVTVSTENGDVSGEVTAVTLADGAPELTINGQHYNPADVTRITAKPSANLSSGPAPLPAST